MRAWLRKKKLPDHRFRSARPFLSSYFVLTFLSSPFHWKEVLETGNCRVLGPFAWPSNHVTLIIQTPTWLDIGRMRVMYFKKEMKQPCKHKIQLQKSDIYICFISSSKTTKQIKLVIKIYHLSWFYFSFLSYCVSPYKYSRVNVPLC